MASEQDAPMRTINLTLILAACLSCAACQSNPERAAVMHDGGVAAAPAADVWERIRRGLRFERALSQPSVKNRLRWYQQHQDYIDRVAERATPYLYHIVEELEQRGMPADLALLPVVESAYEPFAYSRSDASGIWQFIPGTGRLYGLRKNWWYDGRRDIVAATEAALDYLQKLHRRFDGDWLHALAAYNSGERKVARALRRNRKAGRDTDFFSLRLPRETRGYVPSLLALAEALANAERHGARWTPIKNEPHFAVVDAGEWIDLAVAARLAGLEMAEFYILNPGFERWATAPGGPHRLLVPVAAKTRFEAELAALPAGERLRWEERAIRRGETLGKIAARHRVSVQDLQRGNRMRGTAIQAGRSLLVPVASEPEEHYSLSADNRLFRGLKRAGDGEHHIYTIKRGDTLWEIGRRYGFSVRQLAAWNRLNPHGVLRPGQRLALWLDR